MTRALDDAQRTLMPTALRLTIYGLFGAVWATGCAWLVLHWFFETPDEFGMSRHPWEPSLLTAHGVLSILSAFALGWIMAKHASEAWQQHKRRASGGTFTIVIACLCASGFLLFFAVQDDIQQLGARVHEILGLAVTLFAVEHWRRSPNRG